MKQIEGGPIACAHEGRFEVIAQTHDGLYAMDAGGHPSKRAPLIDTTLYGLGHARSALP
jgi:hypothetical protein